MKRALLIAAIAVVAAAAGSAAASHVARARVPRCPGHTPKAVTDAVAARHFVRSGATVMRLCRYYGVNFANSHALFQQNLIRASVTIGDIARTFNGLDKPPKGIFCMRDDDSRMLVEFGYPGAPAERILVKLTGCPFATNGRATRWATPRLQHRLIKLAKPR